MESTLKLYQLADCPYCHLVRRKLDFLGVPYLAMPVPRKGEDRAELIKLSGQRAVPVLVDGETVLSDSKKIIDYLDEKFEGQEMSSGTYGIFTQVAGDAQTVYDKTVEALKAVGFGLLTEIDVAATMKKKINEDLDPYMILGFCNPKFAFHGISNEPDLGLLLPCNVIIREVEPGKFRVGAAHPVKMFLPVGRPDMLPLAEEVTGLMKKAIDSLS